jgi:hypothetical protein
MGYQQVPDQSYRIQTSEVTTLFWKLQLSIIAHLRLVRLLSVIVAIVIPDHDDHSISTFTKGLKAAHWKVTSREVSYSNIDNTIANSCSIITAVHSSCASNVDPIIFKTPPRTTPRPISAFIWEPFNRPEHSLCYGQDNIDFNKKRNFENDCQHTKTSRFN